MIDPLKNLPGYALRRASSSMMTAFNNRLSPLGVSSTEASTLLMIKSNTGMTQSDLGRSLGIKRANMAPLIGRLDDKGMISRTPVDGRSQGLALTQAGDELAAAIQKVVDVHEAQLIARLPVVARATFIEALSALWD